MKEAIKLDLIEALKSGDHYQAEGVLEDRDGLQCCLGVLCDIMDVPRHVKTFGPFDSVQVLYGYGDDEMFWSDTELPKDVREETGLSSHEMGTLMGFNDEGRTFRWIASYVEECL